MKKIWSLVLALALIMTTFAVPVSAAGVSVEDIAISTNVYDITCTVETETKAVMTAMLTNIYETNTSASLHGILSDRTPDEIYDADGAVIGYKYTFNFNMLEDVDTGWYVVNIGFGGVTTPKEFAYACLDDQITFYDSLNVKEADDIKGYFANNPLLVPVELGFYNSLDEEKVLPKVNAQIAALDLATGVTDADNTEAKIEKLAPVVERFTARFAELMKVSAAVVADSTAWQDLVSRNIAENVFNGYYYSKNNVDESAVLYPADMYEEFCAEAAKMTDYTTEELAQTFDKATLVHIEKARSVGILKDAFTKFVLADNNTIDISATGKANIKNVVASANGADFWDSLRDAANTDCASLIANAESIAQTMIDNGTAGGTTGGVTGGTVIDKPTGNGGGGGMAAGAPKPEETDTPEVPVGTFTDIADIEWAKEAIEALAEMGVLAGKGNGKFAPNDSVTREEFVKIIVAAFELSDDAAECDFNDVSKDDWSYSFIASAAKLGIVSGDGESFNPKAGISRQDMAVIIHRVFEHLGAEVNGDAISFDDSAEISEYAKAAVEALTAAGIINGMGDGTFAPAGTVTRAQAAKVVYGLLDLVGGGK